MKRLSLCLMVFFILLPHLSSVWAADYPNNYVGKGYGTDMDKAIKQGTLSSRPYGTDVFLTQIMALGCQLLPTFGPDGCTNDKEIYAIMQQNSIIAKINEPIVAMFTTPPANTYAFVVDTGKQLGFIPKSVNAQGVGFAGFSNLLPLWKIFRNFAYLIMAIIMIVIGFMIMLRKKIDPKTVITVQSAIPRIVLTLILITFSYAIVGICIDIMYILIFFIVAVFKTTGLLPTPNFWAQIDSPTVDRLYTQGGLLANFLNIDISIYRLIGINVSSLAGLGISTGVATLGTVLFAASGLLATGPVLLFPFGIGMSLAILNLLLGLGVLLLIIRLLFFFLGAYIQIVIALIIGPIQLIFNAIPGNNSFSSWLKNLVANIAVFPLASVVFMLSGIFHEISTNSKALLWQPPYAGILHSTTSIASLVSLGLLFFIPTIGAQLKEVLKSKPMVQAGPEGIAGAFSQPAQIGFQLFSQWQSHTQMKNLGNIVSGNKSSGGGGKN